MEIAPVGPIRASVRVPGSKSHTNRSLVIAGLARGRSVLEGALFADDTEAMTEALRALGLEVAPDEAARRIEVSGLGGRFPSAGPGREVAIGARDAGTVMRFLTAVVAGSEGRFVIDGSPRMRERPIGDLLEGLRSMGVLARSLGRDGFPPVEVEARGLPGGTVAVSAESSSQFASALLLAAPMAGSPVTIVLEGAVASRPFIDLTVHLMREFGVRVECHDGRVFRVPAPSTYRAGVHRVQGDATAAGYFWAAAAVTGGRLAVENVGTASLQGDARFADILELMGARVTRSEGATAVEGTGRLMGGEFNLRRMPDVTPTLAVTALFAGGPTAIKNVGVLRGHESDRIAALAAELPKLGASVEELEDGLVIRPPEKGPTAVAGARISPHGDHRMAMSFAVAGLAVPGVVIEDPGCVSKTYPGFFDDLERVAATGRRAEGPER